jgi:proteasome assembly chaperone (PAC2) family protein
MDQSYHKQNAQYNWVLQRFEILNNNNKLKVIHVSLFGGMPHSTLTKDPPYVGVVRIKKTILEIKTDTIKGKT